MGYYAHGNGTAKVREGITIPASVLAMLGREFSEVKDTPDGNLILEFEYGRYHEEDVAEVLRTLAHFADGTVEFTGDDESHWRFVFDGGKIQYEAGRIVYEPVEMWNRQSHRAEMIGCIIDSFEDWLTDKGITAEDIPNDDRDGDDDAALIYGCDYAELEDAVKDTLVKWGLLEEDE